MPFRLKTWFQTKASQLDPLITTRASSHARTLRAQLAYASFHGSAINQPDLDHVLHTFPLPEGSIWSDATVFEQKQVRKALIRAAKDAHPLIALRSLRELWELMSSDEKKAVERSIEQGSVYVNSLHYILSPLGDNHFAPFLLAGAVSAIDAVFIQSISTERADRAVALIQSATIDSWLPYLFPLASLPRQNPLTRTVGEAASDVVYAIRVRLSTGPQVG